MNIRFRSILLLCAFSTHASMHCGLAHHVEPIPLIKKSSRVSIFSLPTVTILLGCGVIALGVLCALQYRRAQKLKRAIAQKTHMNTDLANKIAQIQTEKATQEELLRNQKSTHQELDSSLHSLQEANRTLTAQNDELAAKASTAYTEIERLKKDNARLVALQNLANQENKQMKQLAAITPPASPSTAPTPAPAPTSTAAPSSPMTVPPTLQPQNTMPFATTHDSAQAPGNAGHNQQRRSSTGCLHFKSWPQSAKNNLSKSSSSRKKKNHVSSNQNISQASTSTAGTLPQNPSTINSAH